MQGHRQCDILDKSVTDEQKHINHFKYFKKPATQLYVLQEDKMFCQSDNIMRKNCVR